MNEQTPGQPPHQPEHSTPVANDLYELAFPEQRQRRPRDEADLSLKARVILRELAVFDLPQ